MMAAWFLWPSMSTAGGAGQDPITARDLPHEHDVLIALLTVGEDVIGVVE